MHARKVSHPMNVSYTSAAGSRTNSSFEKNSDSNTSGGISNAAAIQSVLNDASPAVDAPTTAVSASGGGGGGGHHRMTSSGGPLTDTQRELLLFYRHKIGRREGVRRQSVAY